MRKRQLRTECVALQVTRRVIVVIVEPALTDGDRAAGEEGSQRGHIRGSVERSRIVRVYASGEEDDAGMGGGNGGRPLRGGEGLADADHGQCAGLARALNDNVPIVIERGIGEVCVTIDERDHGRANRRARRRFSKR